MSDNIDYDELDKAVNQAIKANTKKATAPKPAAKAPVAQKTPAAKPAATARPRGHQYMDFVRRAPSAATPRPSKPVAIPKPQPTIAPKPVARKAAAPVVTPKPVKLIPNAAIKKTAPAARKATAASMPQYRTASANARAAAKTAAAPKAAVKAEPKATIERTPAPAKQAAAPNANNFSIGGKSPFLANTQVEKTPLGSNPQQNSVNSIESTKNTYSQKSPIAAKNSKKHIVTEDPSNHSGWLRVLGVILMIAAGLGLGLLAWLIISPNLGK